MSPQQNPAQVALGTLSPAGHSPCGGLAIAAGALGKLCSRRGNDLLNSEAIRLVVGYTIANDITPLDTGCPAAPVACFGPVITVGHPRSARTALLRMQ
jgi:hypothetical protein